MPNHTPTPKAKKDGDPSEWQKVWACGKGCTVHRDRCQSAFQDSRAEQFASAWVFSTHEASQLVGNTGIPRKGF